jgi:hypothetical protein
VGSERSRTSDLSQESRRPSAVPPESPTPPVLAAPFDTAQSTLLCICEVEFRGFVASMELLRASLVEQAAPAGTVEWQVPLSMQPSSIDE